MDNKLATVCICIVASLWLIITGANNFKKIHGKGYCNVINGIDDIKHIIKRKNFVVCEGECNVNYRETAYNIFNNYSDEFVVMYCGKDKDELPSQLKENYGN